MDASLLFIVACVSASFAGCLVGRHWIESRNRKQQQKVIQSRCLEVEGNEIKVRTSANRSLPDRVATFITTQSKYIELKPQKGLRMKGFWKTGEAKFMKMFIKSGLDQNVTFQGFCYARALLCLGLAALCSLVGAVFSTELMLLGALLGTVFGWRLPSWAIKQQVDTRKENLEDHLSEMLEVVSLGLRSGLSFDRSFELYHSHFHNKLGDQAFSTQHQWQLGLKTREEALRDFALTYDSVLFSRVIENVIRSLRFGSSLADSFEAAAFEARTVHKAHREEEVAKAPVKMLVPTAALILPAMLLLVLGPVLLEMIHGF